MSDKDLVRKYFDNAVDRFDSIYKGEKFFLFRFLDRHFRFDMYERFDLTFRHCGEIKGKKVLDVGCGSGRYSIEFARQGAKKVVGIDFATKMLTMAKRFAVEDGVDEICCFVNADFLTYDFDDIFNISIATGFFDYIRDPKQVLIKMKNLTSEKIIATFPSKSVIRTPIRKIRYKLLKRCPVSFYNRKDIENILLRAGFKDYRIIKIKGSGMDYFVVIKL